MDIRNYLTSKGWNWREVKRPKGLVAVGSCFFCDDKEKSFGISLQDGAWSCLRLNNCGKKGSWADFQRLLGDPYQPLDNSTYIKNQPIKYDKPKVEIKITDQAIEWLKKRGIWEATSATYKISQSGNEIMFPYYKQGELVNVKYRSMTEKKFRQEKNAEPALFGMDFCNGKEELTIVEGEIDCLTMNQYGFDVVSIPSGAADSRWIEAEWDFLNTFKKIYLCLDGDEAGQKNIENIVNRLGKWRCYNVILPFKDANECLANDVTDEKIKECFENARGFDPPTLLTPMDFYDDIVYYNENFEKRFGTSTPWTKLTKILKGWRDAELTIWSGRSGSGKSTILNDILLHDIKKGIKSIIASLEMSPMKYLNWMIMRDRQKAILDRSDIKESLKSFTNLYIVNIEGQTDQTELFNVLDFAARKYGVKRFVIDSLMKIDIKGNDKYEEQKNFINKLIDNIAKKYDGHIHLVAHPRKSFKDTDRPDKVDVSGSGDITNLADNVLLLYRVGKEEREKNLQDEGDSADTVLYVRKNREHGLEGEVNFHFNPDTKTFTEMLAVF
jgi:twinkle protein